MASCSTAAARTIAPGWPGQDTGGRRYGDALHRSVLALLAILAVAAAGCGSSDPPPRPAPDAVVEVGAARVELVLPDGPGPFPVLVHIPGGGWTHVDDTDVWHAFGHDAAVDDGWALATLRYRPAGGGVTAADQAADVDTALGWVAAGGDGRGLGAPMLAMGHSAGAHVLALAVAHQQDPVPDALVLVAGVYDFAPDVLAGELLQDGVRQALGCTLGCRPAISLEPARWIDGDEPPTTLVHGTADRVTPPAGSERFATALRSVGVAVELMPVDGGAHVGEGTDDAVRDVIARWRDQLLRDRSNR